MTAAEFSQKNRFHKIGIPDELADVLEALLHTGVEWGNTQQQTDRDHIKDFEDDLRITRADHQMPRRDLRAMHGVYLKGTNTIICQTGISPNSALHARLIAGALQSIPNVLETTAKLREALEMALTAFQEYEQLHLAKGTADGDEKAKRNAELAEAMRAALDWRPGERK